MALTDMFKQGVGYAAEILGIYAFINSGSAEDTVAAGFSAFVGVVAFYTGKKLHEYAFKEKYAKEFKDKYEKELEIKVKQNFKLCTCGDKKKETNTEKKS